MASLNKQHRRAQRAKGKAKQTRLQHAGAYNPAYKARPLKNLFTASPTLEFTYLDHRTQTYQRESLTQSNMLRRVIQHIPEKHFRMIRYFGFLANRVCGQSLPVVYQALKMQKPGKTPTLYFVQMIKAFLNRDPFSCLLCGARMVYTRAIARLTVQGLLINARDIGLLRFVRP